MKKIIMFLIIITLLFFIGCDLNEKPKEETTEETPIQNNDNQEKEEQNNENQENNDPKEEEPKEPVIGSLYVHYVLDNNKSDFIDKVTSIDEYEFIIPKMDGYSFDGWYVNSDLTIELEKRFLVMSTDEKDIEVMAYAAWVNELYDVKFMDGDDLISLQHVSYGKGAKEPQATLKAGYRFVGWDKDFSYITNDITINAVYEKQDLSKNIMVILGNWMNNDGTISATMRQRLELALELYATFSFDYIVVTGGMANSQAGISEAQAMYDYLVSHGINKNIIIKEDQSMSTQQNATYTMTKLENIDFNNLIIVSTIEHFVNYQTIKFFNDAARNNTKIKNKGIHIMIYTNNGGY